MNPNFPTLAIYGIQDRDDYPHPFYVHDHNLALMQNAEVISFLQQERISRRKRDNTLHVHLKEILKEKKLLGSDYDLVFVDNVVGRTFLTTKGDARFEAPLNPKLSTLPEEGRCWWFGKEQKAWVLNHELAHIFSCLPFFGEFKENSLLVHFDGGASLSNFSAATFRKGKLEWIEYHWDLKPYSTIFNANALVFSMLGAKLPEQNAVPGKFMGFAGHGSYRPEIERWLLKNNLFQDIWGKTSHFFKKAKEEFDVEIKSFDQKDPFIQDTAATLHKIFTGKLVEKLKALAQDTGTEYLYYTGGSALNIVANTEIINSSIFKDVFIPPCTEDSGLALGAAAYVDWLKHKKAVKHSPYLNNWGIEPIRSNFDHNTIRSVAEDLVEGKIIGVCNDFGEAGPRALGNRSILALAGSRELSKNLSMVKKGREWYRPLAPIALERNTRYFTGVKEVHHLSRYMLLDFPVLPEHRKELSGATHADGTARFQTLFTRSDNPFMYELLDILDRQYNIKALINTSFNRKGEPIVHSEHDAVDAAKAMKLDGLVIHGRYESIGYFCNE